MNSNRSGKVQQRDLTDNYSKKFTQKLLEPLSKTTSKVEYHYTEGLQQKIGSVVLLGLSDEKKYKEGMMDQLISIMEDLASRGYVKAFLSKFLEMELSTGEYAVHVMPALTKEGVEYVTNTYKEYMGPITTKKPQRSA